MSHARVPQDSPYCNVLLLKEAHCLHSSERTHQAVGRVWKPTVWDSINYSVVSVCFSDFICHQGAQNHSEEWRWAEMLAVKYLAYRRNLSTVWCLEVLWGCWEGRTVYSTVLQASVIPSHTDNQGAPVLMTPQHRNQVMLIKDSVPACRGVKAQSYRGDPCGVTDALIRLELSDVFSSSCLFHQNWTSALLQAPSICSLPGLFSYWPCCSLISSTLALAQLMLWLLPNTFQRSMPFSSGLWPGRYAASA